MKISEVGIKNFRGYGENELDEQRMYRFKNLDQYKLIILTGFNGFGKTSFVDAIEWCLTNKISRIDELEKTLMASNLKKSHYLKFTNGTNDKNREVEVELKFDNGFYIRRTTQNYSLYEANYESYIFDKYGKIVDQEAIKQAFANEGGYTLDDIFNVCFCGQDSIAALLRATSATQRTKVFMQLLGLNQIGEIVENSEGNKFRGLSNKIRNLSNKLDESTKDQEIINNIFKINDWGTIEEYKNTVQEKISEFMAYTPSNWNNSKVIGLKKCKYTSLREIGDFISKAGIVYTAINDELDKNIEQKNLLREVKFMKRWIDDIEYSNAVVYIKNFSIYDKEQILAEVTQKKEGYSEKIDITQERINKIHEYIINMEAISNRLNNVDEIEEEPIYLLEEMYIEIKSKALSVGVEARRPQIRKLHRYVQRLVESNKRYSFNIDRIKNSIAMKKQELVNISSLNKDYSNMLIQVKQYINEQENIDTCPVCLNSKIKVDNNEQICNKEVLINIIDNTLQKGNRNIALYTSRLNEYEGTYKYIVDLYKRKVKDKFKKLVNEYIEVCTDMCSKVEKIYIKQRECQHENISKLMQRETILINEINNFKSDYKKIFNKEFDGSIDAQMNEVSIESKIKMIQRWNIYRQQYIGKKYGMQYGVTEEDVCNKYTQLVKETQEKGILDIPLKEYVMRIREIDKTCKLLNIILMYKLSEENQNVLNRYLEIKDKESDYKSAKNLLEGYADDRSKINERAKEIQEKLLLSRLQNNPLILWIYNQINPHPKFREFKIVNSKSGTNIMSKLNKDIYLDHMFSTAQTNVLALSIFLGIALMQRSNSLEQIYMDDPIQSMDDINMVSYIDLIRNLSGIKEINKSIIITTHDHNFSKLLNIKMRNKKYKQFVFTSYGEEGPTIKEIENDIEE